MKPYAALAGQIEQTLVDLTGVVNRVDELLKQARQTSDRAYLEAAALYLHSFYSGVEQIFVEIARQVDEDVPAHENWHKVLVLQMAAEIPAVRPAVIGVATRHCLDEYRAFRHVVRNVYTFNVNPNRITDLAVSLQSCHEAVQQDLRNFRQFLLDVSSG
ncbi:MAG TPA: hypothetical protein VF177_23150 [Anaerolineae bacterium]